MKFQAEKEWVTQNLWVGKWQMCYLVIPQETYLCSVTSLDMLSQDYVYKCKFLFTVTHIRPALNHELLTEFAMSTQGIWQSLFAAAFIPKYGSNHQICLLTHGLDLRLVWSIDLNPPVCSQVLEWLCLWFKKMMFLCSESQGGCFFHCPWKPATSLHYTVLSVYLWPSASLAQCLLTERK